MKPLSRLGRVLLTWWGLYQLGHLASNAWAAGQLVLAGQVGFPAPPPPGGWPLAAQQMLIAMALLDSLNAFASLYFICKKLHGDDRFDWLGGVTLALFNYAAIFFALLTALGGAWVGSNLWVYLAINLGYLPILWLALRWLRQAARPVG